MKQKPILRVPKKVSVLGEEWKIDIVKKPINEGKECNGICNPRTKTITLKEGFALSTLWHEVGHLILFTGLAENSEFNANILGKFLEQLSTQIYFKN